VSLPNCADKSTESEDAFTARPEAKRPWQAPGLSADTKPEAKRRWEEPEHPVDTKAAKMTMDAQAVALFSGDLAWSGMTVSLVVVIALMKVAPRNGGKSRSVHREPNVPDQRLAALGSAITHDNARESFASSGSSDVRVHRGLTQAICASLRSWD
jgi:hypothetical protein